MSTPSETTTPIKSLPPNVAFLQNHQPALPAGDYEIKVAQGIKTKSSKIPQQTFSSTRSFSVRCERFVMNPADVEVRFPKPGSTGAYSNVLPHMVFKRATLPWERFGDENHTSPDPDMGWMALLLFAEGEAPKPQVVTVLNLLDGPPEGTVFPKVYQVGKVPASPTLPYLELEHAQPATEQLTVIDVPVATLQKVLPQGGELCWLSHVRQPTDETSVSEGDALSVVVGNRLPQLGGRSTVHLVSIEHRWTATGGLDLQGATGSDKVRLVSLMHWDFYCSEHFKVTETVLTSQSWVKDPQKKALAPVLGREVVSTQTNFEKQLASLLGKLATADEIAALVQKAKFTKTLEGLLLALDQNQMTLRLPPNADATAESYLASGFVPVEHRLRNGDTTYSWYHSPLVPTPTGFTAVPTEKPARCSDALLRYFPSIGMFDVSYAAAWELGRLLALRDKRFSVGLYHYKRMRSRNAKAAANVPAHLADMFEAAVPGGTAPDETLQQRLVDWFDRLKVLGNVPFNYLVPDEKMLPPESIRFFYVDPYWVASLLDGAFSLGRATASDYENDQQWMKDLGLDQVPPLSGFLLRSEAVTGWPGLLVDGYSTAVSGTQPPATPPMPQYRYQLSPHVLLCLFEAKSAADYVRTVDFHQKPEVIHFGFDDDDGVLLKPLKNDQGTQVNSCTITVKDKTNTQKIINSDNVVDMTKMVSAMKPYMKELGFTPAELGKEGYMPAVFALEMIEGVVRVRFDHKKTTLNAALMSCPKCGGELAPYEQEDMRMERCGDCGGSWFDWGEMEALLGDHAGVDVPVFARKTELVCPRCSGLLWAHPLPEEGVEMEKWSVEIDQCKQCHGIWLDHTELDKVRQSRDRRGLKGLLKRFF